MGENRFRILDRTGLKVGRLGVACSYGAPTAAFGYITRNAMILMRWMLKNPTRHDTGARNAV